MWTDNVRRQKLKCCVQQMKRLIYRFASDCQLQILCMYFLSRRVNAWPLMTLPRVLYPEVPWNPTIVSMQPVIRRCWYCIPSL